MSNIRNSECTNGNGGSVLTSRKCSSTPSLPQATTDTRGPSVAAFDQAASDDNLTAKVLLQILLLHDYYSNYLILFIVFF